MTMKLSPKLTERALLALADWLADEPFSLRVAEAEFTLDEQADIVDALVHHHGRSVPGVEVLIDNAGFPFARQTVLGWESDEPDPLLALATKDEVRALIAALPQRQSTGTLAGLGLNILNVDAFESYYALHGKTLEALLQSAEAKEVAASTHALGRLVMANLFSAKIACRNAFSAVRREAGCTEGADPAEEIMAHYTLPLRGHLREGFVQGPDRELFRARSCRTLVCTTYIDERHIATLATCRV